MEKAYALWATCMPFFFHFYKKGDAPCAKEPALSSFDLIAIPAGRYI